MSLKIKTPPQTLDALIVIYTYNTATYAVSHQALNLESNVILPVLKQLTQIGILKGDDGYNKTIAVTRDKALNMMVASGNYIDSVVFHESIYKNQKSVQQRNPDLIKSPEKQILGLSDRAAVEAETAKNEKFAKPLKKALKILFVINVLLGGILLIIEVF